MHCQIKIVNICLEFLLQFAYERLANNYFLLIIIFCKDFGNKVIILSKNVLGDTSFNMFMVDFPLETMWARISFLGEF